MTTPGSWDEAYARFETGDVLRLGDLGLTFGTVIDRDESSLQVRS